MVYLSIRLSLPTEFVELRGVLSRGLWIHETEFKCRQGAVCWEIIVVEEEIHRVLILGHLMCRFQYLLKFKENHHLGSSREDVEEA